MFTKRTMSRLVRKLRKLTRRGRSVKVPDIPARDCANCAAMKAKLDGRFCLAVDSSINISLKWLYYHVMSISHTELVEQVNRLTSRHEELLGDLKMLVLDE